MSGALANIIFPTCGHVTARVCKIIPKGQLRKPRKLAPHEKYRLNSIEILVRLCSVVCDLWWPTMHVQVQEIIGRLSRSTAMAQWSMLQGSESMGVV